MKWKEFFHLFSTVGLLCSVMFVGILYSIRYIYVDVVVFTVVINSIADVDDIPYYVQLLEDEFHSIILKLQGIRQRLKALNDIINE